MKGKGCWLSNVSSVRELRSWGIFRTPAFLYCSGRPRPPAKAPGRLPGHAVAIRHSASEVKRGPGAAFEAAPGPKNEQRLR